MSSLGSTSPPRGVELDDERLHVLVLVGRLNLLDHVVGGRPTRSRKRGRAAGVAPDRSRNRHLRRVVLLGLAEPPAGESSDEPLARHCRRRADHRSREKILPVRAGVAFHASD
jgi:hypothetical protein